MSRDMVLNAQFPSYGNCSDCKRQRTATAWCKNCDIAILKENFLNWTSGNSKIDEFIKFTQLNASGNMDYLEWIDFDQFDLVKNINKRGAFSSMYSAVWLEGPKWNLDEEAEEWTRSGPIKVILKRLDNSQNISQEFVNQVAEADANQENLFDQHGNRIPKNRLKKFNLPKLMVEWKCKKSKEDAKNNRTSAGYINLRFCTQQILLS
ncbi:hypothetical protein C1645_806099 [Glomus cerebriforme]|uniref:Uncharacterized protein n=1 Tax=Glomus cerebriforme TaxID=658196 RepID=A0A397T3X1_9GLOM|nr:hypothetical protein C1645_806099 [Glomus cerebriforme]